jgi:phage RecT family recombinase
MKENKENKAIQKIGPTEIGAFLNEKKKLLAGYATRNYEQAEFIRGALVAIENDENLTACLSTEKGQASLYNALKIGASNGLSLNPLDGEAYMIAYKGEVSYQIGKNGFIALAFGTGKVKNISCDVVRENDEFTISKTMGQESYNHVPARKNRGAVDGYYAAMLTEDGVRVEYMTAEEIEEHAVTYSAQYKYWISGDKSGKVPIWVKSRDGMGLKTVIKSLLRKNKINPTTTQAIAADDQGEAQIIDITPDNPEKKQGDMV